MMWNYGGHMSGWGWAFMGISSLLFWALVITGIVLLTRYVSNNSKRSSHDDRDLTSAEILSRRFARGEISEDEFVAKTKLIKH